MNRGHGSPVNPREVRGFPTSWPLLHRFLVRVIIDDTRRISEWVYRDGKGFSMLGCYPKKERRINSERCIPHRRQRLHKHGFATLVFPGSAIVVDLSHRLRPGHTAKLRSKSWSVMGAADRTARTSSLIAHWTGSKLSV